MVDGDLQALAIAAAQAAGDVLRGPLADDAGVHGAIGRDIKTQADVDADAAVLELIRPTGIPVLSEESAADDDFDIEQLCWIVDPLDGTMNYVRSMPLACVSVALWQGGRPVFGVIHDFTGEGTWCGGPSIPSTHNGKPIQVNSMTDTSQAVLATGFPRARAYTPDALAASLARMAAFKKVRMIGAAALSLAWTAMGRMDLYHEEQIFLWDVAAGLAIVRGAGGAAHWTSWDSQWRSTVFAGAPGLMDAASGRITDS